MGKTMQWACMQRLYFHISGTDLKIKNSTVTLLNYSKKNMLVTKMVHKQGRQESFDDEWPPNRGVWNGFYNHEPNTLDGDLVYKGYRSEGLWAIGAGWGIWLSSNVGRWS